MTIKLALITSHPIQYNAPLFKHLALCSNISVKVFYTLQRENVEFDKGFGIDVIWDIPLLSGYDYQFVSNSRKGKNYYWSSKSRELINLVNEFGATYILVFGWNYFSHYRAMSYFKNKIPVLFRGDSTLIDKKNIFYRILRLILLSFIYRKVDYALYVGTANREYFLKFGLKSNKLIFAPHAIDNGRFEKINNEHLIFINNIRIEFGISEDSFTVIFCGKLLEKKNPLLLIQAINIINNPNLHLIIVGSGLLDDSLKKASKAYRNVHFLPFQNQSLMPAIYRLGDIFCLPSKGPGESWGLAINEAMACNRAILVSNKCGCAIDLVKNGFNGYIFESDNLFDLVLKLRLMIANRNDLKEMGKNSKKMIESWNYDQIVKTINTEIFNIGESI